jgi:hypothetical protein
MKGLLWVACLSWRKRRATHWRSPANLAPEAVEQIGVLPGEPRPATHTDPDTDAAIRKLFARTVRTPEME